MSENNAHKTFFDWVLGQPSEKRAQEIELQKSASNNFHRNLSQKEYENNMKSQKFYNNKIFARSVFELEKMGSVSINIDNHDNSALNSTPRGIPVYRPTVGKIRDYAANMINQDLQGISDIVTVRSVDVIPKDDFAVQDVENYEISDASGLITLQAGTKKFEVPFIIIDKKFVPFDVIQAEGERVPYSVENLRKISRGLASMKESDGVEGFDPYVEVVDRHTPATSTGFMEEIMKIRNRFSRQGAVNPGYLSAVAEEVDYLLEKTATLTPLTADDLNQIRDRVNELHEDKVSEKFIKIASAFEEENALPLMTEAEKDTLVDVRGKENGDVVRLPIVEIDETNKAKSQSLDFALVAKNILQMGDRQRHPEGYLLLPGGRYKKIGETETVLVHDAAQSLDSISFFLKLKNIDSLIEGEYFMVPKGDCFFEPVEAKVICEIVISNDRLKTGRYARDYNSWKLPHGDEARAMPKIKIIRANVPQKIWGPTVDKDVSIIIPCENATKFERVSFPELVSMKAKELSANEIMITKAISSQIMRGDDFAPIYICPPNTKVVMLEKPVTGTISNILALEETMDMMGELLSEKTAMAKETVTVMCRDKYADKFEVVIRYINRDAQIFKEGAKTFKDIEEYKVKGILKTLGFTAQNSKAMIEKAKKDRTVQAQIVDTSRITEVFGGKDGTAMMADLGSIKDAILNDKLVENGAAKFVADKLVDVGSSVVMGASDILSKLSSTAENNAWYFEKAAMTSNNQEFLDIAKSQLLGAKYFEKTANMFSGDIYMELGEISGALTSLEPILEKIAYDLDDLRYAQIENRHEIIDYGIISNSIYCNDQLLKIAKIVKEF